MQNDSNYSVKRRRLPRKIMQFAKQFNQNLETY